ncbi:MAG: metallophosphoesterase family protein [Planctomycetota bacterium]
MARIGLLSDSHGRAATTRRAVDLLRGAGAEVLIHLGDVGTVEVIDALCVDDLDGEDQIEAHVVFGNTDWDHASLATYAEDLDIVVDDPVGCLKLAQGATAPALVPTGATPSSVAPEQDVIMFCHGHEEHRIAEALAAHPRYFCHGHTHRQADTQNNGTRIINPGALFRAAAYTVALLDTATDRLTFYEVDSGR